MPEGGLHERMEQEARERPRPERIEFPEYAPLTTAPRAPRAWQTSHLTVEPNYVCHGRLYFEQPNFERGGWELGYLTPLANVGVYYYDLALLPYHAWTDPCRCFECSAGYCLPGDPIPFLLYPPGVSLTGALAEGGVAVALFAIFP